MKVLIAGALGDLGVKTAEFLLERGHEVHGLTRSKSRVSDVEGRGMQAVVGDLLDRDSTMAALDKASPDAVIQVPIGLPDRGPLRPRDLESTNRLRVEGTRHLLEASLAHGVRRIVSESIVAIYGYGGVGNELDEGGPVATSVPLRAVQPALDALHTQERIVLDAARAGRIEGIVVRIGFYYGAGVGSTLFMAKLLRRGFMPVARKAGSMPWVELSDAARGVVAALEKGRSGEVYNIVGDVSAPLSGVADELARALGTRPARRVPLWVMKLGARYAGLMSEIDLRISNAKAKAELGWEPRFPTVREGIANAMPEIRERVLS